MKRYVKSSSTPGWTAGRDSGFQYYFYEMPRVRAVVQEIDDNGNYGYEGRIYRRHQDTVTKKFMGKGSRDAAMTWAEGEMFGESITSATEPTGKVTLICKYEKYMRYETGGLHRVQCTGKDLLDALKKLTTKVGTLYLDPEQIEEDNMTADEVLDEIMSTNGDGCDWIVLLQNKTTGETYIDETDYYDDEVI